MIIHYGYSDGEGEYRISVDTDKCDGCGACVEVCPKSLFELQLDDYDEMKVVVRHELVKKIGYLCPGISACARNGETCHNVCPHNVFEHSW